MNNKIKHLKGLINSLRDLRKTSIITDLSEEQNFYLNQGYKEGLCSAAMVLADEIDALCEDPCYMEDEENWWHDEDKSRINERLK